MENEMLTGYLAGQSDSNNCNNGGFFGNDGIWAVLLFAMIFGWGNGGWGGFGGVNNAGLQGAVTRADLSDALGFQGLDSAVRGVQNGLCDGFFALNNTVQSGFHGVDNAICNLGFTMQNGFNATQVAMMQGFNAAQAQSADCCCKTQTNLMQLGNQVERGFCQTNFNDQANTTAIIQNAHNDTDRVLAKLDAMEMARKDETIAMLRERLNVADREASQAAQNNYLVNQLRPCPIPAYISCNPWATQAPYGSCYNQGCGCNTGCGCC